MRPTTGRTSARCARAGPSSATSATIRTLEVRVGSTGVRISCVPSFDAPLLPGERAGALIDLGGTFDAKLHPFIGKTAEVDHRAPKARPASKMSQSGALQCLQRSAPRATRPPQREQRGRSGGGGAPTPTAPPQWWHFTASA